MKNRNFRLVTCAALLYGSAFSFQVNAHGWVEFPSARQNTCYEDGGFWNNTIPNAACQAAFDQSGTYPFVQRNELSANVVNYQDINAVKQLVTDGSLCAAGDSAKSGLDVPSPHWQKTAVTLDANNQIELVFHATAAHNPSFWEFYLTKPDYNSSASLTWDDLQLIDTVGNTIVSADGKYHLNVTFPTDRSGDAILYTRWQRQDPAGEGFYNCSDITFSTQGSSTSPDQPDVSTPAADMTALGYFVPQGFGPVESGDTVRLRTFDVNGNEQADIRLAIKANNSSTWAAELAGQFNQLQGNNWFIGIWSEEMEHYMFDTSNIYANQVFAPNASYSYQLSLIKEGSVPADQADNAWDSTTVYTAGDVVIHDGREWTAQWWTQGEQPGTTGQWGVWR